MWGGACPSHTGIPGLLILLSLILSSLWTCINFSGSWKAFFLPNTYKLVELLSVSPGALLAGSVAVPTVPVVCWQPHLVGLALRYWQEPLGCSKLQWKGREGTKAVNFRNQEISSEQHLIHSTVLILISLTHGNLKLILTCLNDETTFKMRKIGNEDF